MTVPERRDQAVDRDDDGGGSPGLDGVRPGGAPGDDPPTVVLVTGANSGIGAAVTSALLARGARVVATVRSAEAAQEVRAANPDAVGLITERLDVTDGAAAHDVIDRHRPHVLVNSAGDALLGAVMDVDDDEVRNQFEALVTGPIRLARLAAVHQRARGGGRIVNVSSTLATTPLPLTAWYAAAKAALDTVSDVLRLELGPDGIDVVRIECGPVRTPAWDGAADRIADGADEATAEARERWTTLTDRAATVFAEPAAVGEVIAEAALDRHPRAVYRVGPGSRFGRLGSLVPRRVREPILAAVFGLRARLPLA